MTKDQYQAALKIILLFLQARGYDSRRAQRDVEDGHWLVQTFEAAFDSDCLSCYQTYLTSALARMENGSYLDGSELLPREEHDWTAACSAEVRTAAGLADSH